MLTPLRLEFIGQRLEEGVSADRIAEEFEMDESAVRRAIDLIGEGETGLEGGGAANADEEGG